MDSCTRSTQRRRDPLWMRQVADWSIGEGVGAAPIVWNDIVYVGKAGGDWGIRGRMMAFNVERRVARLELSISFRAATKSARIPGRTTESSGARRRRGVGDLRARPRYRNAVHSGRQSRAGLQQEHAAGRQSVHDLHRRAGCAHGKTEVVVPASAQRRPRLGRHCGVVVRCRRQETRCDRRQGRHSARGRSRRAASSYSSCR